MFARGERVEVRDHDGRGWISAEFVGVAVGEPRHIDHAGINEGVGYDVDQFRVMYLEGDRDGMFGLHIISEIRRAGEGRMEAASPSGTGPRIEPGDPAPQGPNDG
jgi:hypothetical protein